MPLGKGYLWGNDCTHREGKSVRYIEIPKSKHLFRLTCTVCGKTYKYKRGSMATNEEQ